MQEITLLIREMETLYKDVELLHAQFRALWLTSNKPQGLEYMDFRFGALLARIKIAAQRLCAFTDNKIETIEELDENRLMAGGDTVKPGKSLIDFNCYVDSN